MKAESKTTSSISDSVAAWSWAVSPQNPAITSVVMPQSGITLLIFLTRSRYHSRSYLRLIFSSMALLPDWTGRCMCLQMLPYIAMVYMTSSLMSFGCEVEKRTRSSGLIFATISSSWAKFTSLSAAPEASFQ